MLKGKYLQIAFNRSFADVEKMIEMLPPSKRILIEAGTPFIKNYGVNGISAIKNWWDQKTEGKGYIVADLKCMDRGLREVEIAASAGANAATCLGAAPIETINEFIAKCKIQGIDSMVDMMNITFPFEVLQKLKKSPNIVVLHRGADQDKSLDYSSLQKSKQIPYHQIHQIKSVYNVLISVAGGESFKEARRAIFNDADIAIVWRSFYENPQTTTNLAKEFLKEIR